MGNSKFIGKLFNAWREGRQLRFQQVARIARLPFEDAEDLLCLLIVWNIIQWDRGPRGLVYGLADATALDALETRGPEQFRWKKCLIILATKTPIGVPALARDSTAIEPDFSAHRRSAILYASAATRVLYLLTSEKKRLM